MSFTIDCQSCVRQFSSSCADCVITHLAPTASDEAMVIDLATAAAMRRLQRAGLFPDSSIGRVDRRVLAGWEDGAAPSALPDGSKTLSQRIMEVGRRAGLHAVGVTSAAVLEPAATVLPLRKEAGLAADMQFTYRNPGRSTDPARSMPTARSVIAGAWHYRRAPVAEPEEPAGRVAHYAWRDNYGELRHALEAMAEELRGAGHRSEVHADDNHLVDRNVAYRAGLGWYGKNANLLIPGAGSWFVLGSVITEAELDPTGPPMGDGCASCHRCIDDCPTAAIVGPGVIDARRCLAWLVQARGSIPVEYRAALGDRLYGCDDCQEVCPPNIAGERVGSLAPPAGDADPWIELRWVLTASDAELLARVGRWYLADRNPDVVRRTALVVLGNLGAGHADTAELLQRYLNHEQPLLRAHAVWASRRCGLDQLAAPLRNDPDPAVRVEFDHRVEPVGESRP